jgi:hypothetical protein
MNSEEKEQRKPEYKEKIYQRMTKGKVVKEQNRNGINMRRVAFLESVWVQTFYLFCLTRKKHYRVCHFNSVGLLLYSFK